MQLTNTLAASLLATVAVAGPAPHPHGQRGSTLKSRARQFGAGGGEGNFGGWGGQQGGSASTTTTSTAKPTSTAEAAASTDGASVSTSSKASSSFSSLTTMSNDQWAGAGYSGLYNSGETLKGVSATFNVMDASIPTDADTDMNAYYASAWIGIDGQESCTEITDAGLWQAGVDSYLDSTGAQSFYAWYEWYPAATVEIDIGTISAGDLIFMNLTAVSGTEGTIVVENTSTGETYSKTVTSSNEMCLDTVEWIMEDVTFGTDTEGLASFTPLTFSDAVWVTDAGSYPASNSNEHYDITDRTTTTVSDEKVVITYA